MRLALICAVGAALALAACGDDEPANARPGGPGNGNGNGAPHACTEIGCASGLSMDVRAVRKELLAARRVRICIDAKCRTFDLADQFVMMGAKGLRDKDRVTVRMVVLGGDGKVLARRRTEAPVRRSRPNGPGCPPVCFQIAVHLERDGLRLVPGN